MSGKYFLQSGLRVLELLVKMDIVYEDKDKIILNKPVAGDGKYGGNMAVQAAERIKGIRIKRGCIALCAVTQSVCKILMVPDTLYTHCPFTAILVMDEALLQESETLALYPQNDTVRTRHTLLAY